VPVRCTLSALMCRLDSLGHWILTYLASSREHIHIDVSQWSLHTFKVVAKTPAMIQLFFVM
jgi:hypothetical protein